jgi:flagellar motor switch protein FliM
MEHEEYTEKTVKPFAFHGLKKLKRHDLEVEKALLNYLPFSSHENLAKKAVEDFLTQQFSAEANIQLERFEEGRLSEFVKNLPEPCLVAVLGVQPMPVKALIWIDSLLAQTLIDKILGGEGEVPAEIKTLSPIEEGVFQYLILKSMAEIHQAAGDSAPVHFRLEKIVKSQKELGEMAHAETQSVILNFRVKVGTSLGFVALILPHPLVEGAFLSRTPLDQPESGQEYQYGLKRFEQMGHVRTQLWAEVGSVSLTMAEKNQLEKGDVILFDQTNCQWAGSHLGGNVILRVGEGRGGGFLAQVVSSEAPVLVKILDYYGGE